MATAPRQVLAGTTYLVTRRCSERRFFLRPCPLTNSIFLYVLAVAAKRYGVLVHAYCVLSNHFHLVVTDPKARLPDFHRYMDSLVAKAVNCSLGRWESFWDRDSYSAVRLETPESMIEKVVYTLLNPVSAGLVAHGREWPGLWSDPGAIGTVVEVERPRIFFRKNGPMPTSASLTLAPLPGLEDVPGSLERLRGQLAEAEATARAQRFEEGRHVFGATTVLKQRPFARPAPGEVRRDLNPRVACRGKWKRIEALQRLAAFGRAYREALAAWRAGMRDTVFPAGTWLMRIQHAVPCAAYA